MVRFRSIARPTRSRYGFLSDVDRRHHDGTAYTFVEDERIIALHLRQQLTRLGYDVPNTVSTGDHALRRIEEALPDLVLMDINLKGKLDGIETATAIRQTSVVPIIYITAYSADETLARAAATNPHGYLLKPFSERELRARDDPGNTGAMPNRTRIQAARERLQQADKMEALSRLAGGVADEVDDVPYLALRSARGAWRLCHRRTGAGRADTGRLQRSYRKRAAHPATVGILRPSEADAGDGFAG